MSIQNGYGFVHYPLTDDGIDAALRAVDALHQVTINNISYDCSISNQLRQVLLNSGKVLKRASNNAVTPVENPSSLNFLKSSSSNDENKSSPNFQGMSGDRLPRNNNYHNNSSQVPRGNSPSNNGNLFNTPAAPSSLASTTYTSTSNTNNNLLFGQSVFNGFSSTNSDTNYPRQLEMFPTSLRLDENNLNLWANSQRGGHGSNPNNLPHMNSSSSLPFSDPWNDSKSSRSTASSFSTGSVVPVEDKTANTVPLEESLRHVFHVNNHTNNNLMGYKQNNSSWNPSEYNNSLFNSYSTSSVNYSSYASTSSSSELAPFENKFSIADGMMYTPSPTTQSVSFGLFSNSFSGFN
jgi:hypothetical protein